jgi:hypothetical protein
MKMYNGRKSKSKTTVKSQAQISPAWFLKKVSENSGALPSPERGSVIRTFVPLVKLHLALLHHSAIQ